MKRYRYDGFSCTVSARALIMREPISGSLAQKRCQAPFQVAELSLGLLVVGVLFGTRAITTGEVFVGATL
ncbi:hypothetical protein EP51_23995 [Rhodococcus opacus]|uniref:Uncharacterized protein n=1 Tax=Rhodococcus opacus TaxID=37919 RepID=A0A076EN68_RHOOP|nr:hypothetical protein EP51_23995 [Rhodococcus opacus]